MRFCHCLSFETRSVLDENAARTLTGTGTKRLFHLNTLLSHGQYCICCGSSNVSLARLLCRWRLQSHSLCHAPSQLRVLLPPLLDLVLPQLGQKLTQPTVRWLLQRYLAAVPQILAWIQALALAQEESRQDWLWQAWLLRSSAHDRIFSN